MKRSPFHKPKPVLIFNGAYVLVGITRSIRSASEISGATRKPSRSPARGEPFLRVIFIIAISIPTSK